ncbi:T9SS type A sorting domain-containing protein [Pedobacter sp. SYSU D00535]|uniref:T9SS type A sorting domain-containing protein n=1 Tax=Pedobacter sp. SYSU D00535 TaxID=2810308 RepID=UPI001A96BFD4|nr:T9SS type A sorting domain-containing protein [Pedobacter sp. SYSU D00535]
MHNSSSKRIGFSLILLLFLLITFKTWAAVTVSTASGGLNISADKSVGSSGEAFSPLGTLSISSNLSTDFAANQSNATLVISAPTGWLFKENAGTVTFRGPSITQASISVAATTITITYSTNGIQSAETGISIAGIEVKCSSKRVLSAANITRTSGTASISGFGNGSNCGSLSQAPGNFAKLQVILPGETAAPGTSSGKTGIASVRPAGTSFSFTVSAVDENWNRISSNSNSIQISSSDPNASLPAANTLSSGSRSFSITLRAVGATTITATNVPDNTINATVTTDVVVGPFARLQIILPGEIATPGTSTGKTGTPQPQTAGSPFNVTVNAVDAAWNVITTATDQIDISSTDVNATLPPNAALVNGTQSFSITMKTAGSRTIRAADLTDASKTANTSPSFNVLAGQFSKLLLLLPGESLAPGTSAGKSGTATSAAAGTSFYFTVYATDDYWNRVSSVSDQVKITSTDGHANLPASSTLSSGARSFGITLRGNGQQQISAASTNNPSLSGSANITVATGAFVKLQILLPGETAAPGTITGKTGTPQTQTAGTSFSVVVNAVDAAWNRISSVTDQIKISSSDPNAVLPAQLNLSEGTQSFSITLRTAGSRSVTAADISDASKSAATSSSVSVIPGPFVQLQILLPGESAAPGTIAGKKGTPTARSAGTAFGFTVTAVDNSWNRVSTVSDLIKINCSDANASLPADATLSTGTKTNFYITFRNPGEHTITASDLNNGAVQAATSSTFSVNVGAFARLQLLLPGETAAPGTATGKTGTPTAQTAGVPLNITINAVDNAWNLVTSASDLVKVSSSDPNAILPGNSQLMNGTLSKTVTLKTSGNRTISVSDITDGSKTANSSPSFAVQTGPLAQLQLLLPGETTAPGTVRGKIGNPAPPARGTAFTVNVYATDEFFNRISSVNSSVSLSSPDPAASIPGSSTFSSGGRSFGVNLRSPGTQNITATGAGFSTTVAVPDNIALSTASDYFQSNGNGNWSDASSWQSSSNGLTDWHAATLVPGAAASGILINQDHQITITANTSADQILVAAGGVLQVNASVSLSIPDGAGTDLDVYGTVRNAGTINPTGSIVFRESGKYEHLYTTSAGTVPLATWSEGSSCEFISFTSNLNSIGGMNQNFYHIVWNCPDQNVADRGPSLGGTFSTQYFSLISTGGGELRFGTAGGEVLIKDRFIQSGGTLTLSSSSGTLNCNLLGDFSFNGGIIKEGSGSGKINFKGTSVQKFNQGPAASFSGSIDFTVSTGATVDFGLSVLNAPSSRFVLESGGSLITAHPEGLSNSGSTGTIQTSTRTFSTAGNYTFNGEDAQVSGSGLPATLNNLVIHNSEGLTLSSGSGYTINGTLTISSGHLDMSSSSLQAGPAFSTQGSGILYTANGSSAPLPSNKTWSFSVAYQSDLPQTIVPGSYTNLSFSGAGTKTLAAGTVNVSGDWSSEGGKIDLLLNNPAISFSGSNQQLNDNTNEGLGLIFKNVSFKGSGVKLLESGSFSVESGGTLNVSENATLNANGKLFLLSDENGSASIGALSAGSDITGHVNVQSFITGNQVESYRGTRSMSSPINDAALSKKSFQQLKDYILITGPGNTSRGFDYGGQKTPDAITIQTYNEPAYSGSSIFSPLPTIFESALPGKGYLVYFRGNRQDAAGKLNAPYAAPEDVTVTYSGPINKNTISIPVTNSQNKAPQYIRDDPYNGYNLVGNPYPSTIDWHSLLSNSTNLDDMIVLIKPGGGTATYINGVSNGGATRYIQPGQGFYVKVRNDATTGVVQFTEACKSTSATGAKLLAAPGSKRGVAPVVQSASTRKTFKLVLADDANADEATIVFESGKSEKGTDDAVYFSGSSVSLSTLSADNQNLAVNFLPDLEEGRTIKLFLNATESKNVSLNFPDFSDFGEYDVFLRDALLGLKVDLKKISFYDFSIDKSSAATFGAERFTLEFSKKKAPAVMVTGLNASRTLRAVNLQWACSGLAEVKTLEVERGTASSNLSKVATVPLGEIKPGQLFHFTDTDPKPGLNYYRIKYTLLNGQSGYSDLAQVEMTGLEARPILVYPNPVYTEVNISLPETEQHYIISLYDFSGRKLLEIAKQSSLPLLNVNLASLPPGAYLLEVLQAKTRKVITRTKLIKQ